MARVAPVNLWEMWSLLAPESPDDRWERRHWGAPDGPPAPDAMGALRTDWLARLSELHVLALRAQRLPLDSPEHGIAVAACAEWQARTALAWRAYRGFLCGERPPLTE